MIGNKNVLRDFRASTMVKYKGLVNEAREFEDPQNW
jgi:hypothetical protein